MFRFICAAFVATATVGFGQVISFKEAEIGFGDIDNINPVERLVEFTNAGDKELVIERVKASCGCTSSKLDKLNYQPGESGSLTVTFNPAGKTGAQRKQLTFFSNDAENKVKNVSFTANIVPIWDVQPNRLEFTYDSGAKKFNVASQTLRITNSGANPLTLKSMNSDREEVNIPAPDQAPLQPGESREVPVAVAADFQPENYLGARINTTVEIAGRMSSQSTHVVIRRK